MKSDTPKIDVKHIAKLADLKIKDEDLLKFEKQLNEIVAYVEKLNEVDLPCGKAGTKGVEITSQVTGLENVTREDGKTSPSLSQDEVLSNAKETHNGLFKVDAILDNE